MHCDKCGIEKDMKEIRKLIKQNCVQKKSIKRKNDLLKLIAKVLDGRGNTWCEFLEKKIHEEV